MKRILSFILLFSFIITLNTQVYASISESSIETVKREMQKLLKESNYDVTSRYLNERETKSFFDYLHINSEVRRLDLKLKNDGFKKSNEGTAVFEICDNKSDDAGMFAFEKYTNLKGDSILVIHIYDETTSSIKFTYAQKITFNSKVSNYYVYRNMLTHGANFISFNGAGFICSMGGTIACSLFSAMLFAFVPASIAVGMSCGTAFAWVCSHA